MRVNYYFRDDMDTYKVEAEVYTSNRVQIITVEDSFGADIDIDDFSDMERASLIAKARAARDQLEMLPDEDDNDGDSDESYNEAYE